MTTIKRQPLPYTRTIGSGPTVICLHSSTSSSKQFKPLAALLADSHRVVAVDLYGYGKSPEWNGDRPLTLYDEVSLLEPIFASERGPLHLVGHSYGGAVALKAATIFENRIASLTVYEPVMFCLLPEMERADVDALRSDVERLVSGGSCDEAGRRFVDYWSGNGSWDVLPDWQRETISRRMPKVVHDFEAVMTESTPLSRYAEMQIPARLMFGTTSPRPTRRITELLRGAISNSLPCEVAGAGHMGPMTHPDIFNRSIAGFIGRHSHGSTVSRRVAEIESESGFYTSIR